jgi:hypothetical protein
VKFLGHRPRSPVPERRVAPSQPGPVVHAYGSLARERLLNLQPLRCGRAKRGNYDDSRTAPACAHDMQPVSADVDQTAGRWLPPAVSRLTSRLVDGAGESQDSCRNSKRARNLSQSHPDRFWQTSPR